MARPNFVLVLTDDMEVAPVGHMYRTKALIRAQGAEFQRAYVASPLCAPARATILTGRYPQNTGVRRNSHKAYYEQGDPTRSLPVWLHDAWYRTALVGKYMNGYPAPDAISYIPPGWDVWSVRYRATRDCDGQYDYWLNEDGKSVHYGNRPEHYATDVYRKKGDDAVRVPTWQGVRTQRYTYVEYPGTGERELYDNLLDPHQIANIAATADQALIASLSECSQLLAACAQTACRAAEDLALP